VDRIGSRATTGMARVCGLLVMSEVTLSLVPLVGAGLLVRSLFALRWVDPGFDVEHVFTSKGTLPQNGMLGCIFNSRLLRAYSG
jgi:putative ABC transport system permease protein